MAKRKRKPTAEPARKPPRKVVTFDVTQEQHKLFHSLAHRLECPVSEVGRALFEWAALNLPKVQAILKDQP